MTATNRLSNFRVPTMLKMLTLTFTTMTWRKERLAKWLTRARSKTLPSTMVTTTMLLMRLKNSTLMTMDMVMNTFSRRSFLFAESM